MRTFSHCGSSILGWNGEPDGQGPFFLRSSSSCSSCCRRCASLRPLGCACAQSWGMAVVCGSLVMQPKMLTVPTMAASLAHGCGLCAREAVRTPQGRTGRRWLAALCLRASPSDRMLRLWPHPGMRVDGWRLCALLP